MSKQMSKRQFDWSEIAKDVAIVFVGVLIALYAQQIVDNWQWRAKVRTAEAAMHRELFFDDGPEIYQRAVMHPCVMQRLRAVRDAVQADRSRKEVADLIEGVQLDFASYDNLAIQSAFASDVAAHMPQDRLDAYIQAYQTIPTMDRTNALEAAAVAKLRALPSSGGALSQEEKSRVLEAAEALRNHEALMYKAAAWALPSIIRLGGHLDRKRVQRFMNFSRYHYGTCIKDLPPNWAPQSPFHPDNYRPGQPVKTDD